MSSSLAADGAQRPLSPATDWPPGSPAPGHLVQFYADEAFLAATVADFLAPAVAGSGAAVVVATPEHREAISGALASRGVEVPAAILEGRLILCDARETLCRLLRHGRVDEGCFQASVVPLIERLALRFPGHFRVYGEMVDLLWGDGARQDALRLEALWNGLLARQGFPLLCTYRLERFASAGDGEEFARVCVGHSHVLPAESYTREDDEEARRREVSRLQQQALALQQEVRRRREAEEELRRALAVRDEFLVLAGHELRTPLTALQLQAQFLLTLAEGVSEPVRGRLDRLEGQVARLAEVVEDMLAAFRLSEARVPLVLAEADLKDIVTAAADRLADSVRRSGCSVRIVTEEGIRGRWDGPRLTQVVTNLMTNALKFGRGGLVEVRAASKDGRALLWVRDEGPGVAPEARERIFERFHRAVPFTHASGLGLGLWIARRIVEGHGGRIAVENRPGPGATFLVELPLNPEKEG